MTHNGIAYAKLNLSLDIVSKMPDGYHNIKTVMQSISLGDEISVDCVPGKGVTVDSGLPYLPRDERNIAAKAAMSFFRYTGIQPQKTHIRIKKIIPVCAGLGGGSTDGACVLRILNDMFDTKLSQNVLEEMAGSIGSDVPFCIAGGTRLAEGRGDLLTDLAPIPFCYAVICKPPITCSTPKLFSLIKCDKIRARPDTDGIIEALNRGDLGDVARRMYNVFEDVLPQGARDVKEIKYALLNSGALGAVMTGSGPSVFGLFDDENNAQNAYEQLKTSYRECFITSTVTTNYHIQTGA